MLVVIAGGHGQVARRLSRALVAQGHTVIGLIRNREHATDLQEDGARPVVLDLEAVSVDEVSQVLNGADAVVFAAGAGPGSGDARKQTVDLGAAVLLADAAELVGVRRYLQVSSMGVESVRDGATPEGVDPGFVVYLRAKLAAEEDLRRRDLDWLVVRPGRLTDEPGTGRVRLDAATGRSDVPREDVAAVLAALLERLRRNPASGRRVLELVAGEDPVEEAVTRALGA
ncbi:MAG TPA: NAD(P)-binding oxidoreductase [Actinomycetales bacterium]|nr:NAD(P)-binding oxidoreductase [Actinomycetales bacterium]